MASTTTAGRSTAPASAGSGRCWPASARTTNWRPGAAPRRRRLLAAMEAGASPGKLLPEQVWDGAADPGARTGAGQAERFGHAAGLGACRAHQAAALAGGRRRCSTCRRSRCGATCARSRRARCRPWRPDWRTPSVPAGRVLRLDLPEPALVHWSTDGWQTRNDVPNAGYRARHPHGGDIDSDGLVPGGSIEFTWLDLATETWIGTDYAVAVTAA